MHFLPETLTLPFGLPISQMSLLWDMVAVRAEQHTTRTTPSVSLCLLRLWEKLTGSKGMPQAQEGNHGVPGTLCQC